MALSQSAQRRIMRDDARRRMVREQAELLDFVPATNVPDGVDPYCYSRSLTGVPTPGNRQHRASQSSWNRGLRMSRTVGTALDDAGNAVLTDDGRPTYRRTTANGSVSYVAVPRSGRTSRASSEQAKAPQHSRTNETARIISSARDLTALAEGTA